MISSFIFTPSLDVSSSGRNVAFYDDEISYNSIKNDDADGNNCDDEDYVQHHHHDQHHPDVMRAIMGG